MINITFSELAALDLEDIYNYHLEKAGSATADRQLNSLESCIQTLALMPHLGSRRSDLTDMDVLFFPVLKYFVIYQLRDKWLTIVRILGQRMDIQSLL